MLAENPIYTTRRFISSWQVSDTDPKRLAEELFSVSDETNRRHNNFHFEVANGELIDTATGKVIDFTRTSWLETTEGKVWDSLKIWANTHEEGSATWYSPALEGVYPCDKAVYYQVAYTFEGKPKKVLLSTAVLLDTPQGHFPEELRSKLVINKPDYTLSSLLEDLGQNQNNSTKTPSQKEINYFVEKIKSGVDADIIVAEMKNKGILGSHSISCPTSSGLALTKKSLILNFSSEKKTLCCTCPFCNQQVEAEIYDGKIHCPKCKKEVNWQSN